MTVGRFASCVALAVVGLAGATAVCAGADAPLRITVVGDSSCIPDTGHETACFVINGRHLVDTGWGAVLKMREFGLDPLRLESIIVTHFHHDHYIGLPQLLFYIGLRKRAGAPLALVGPAGHLREIVEVTDTFLQLGRFPELGFERRLVPLRAGDRFETADLTFETFAARHESGKGKLEEALCYKVTENASGACAAFSGDTHHHPPLAGFVKGASVLIHDGSHTRAGDAARIAREAGVARLFLIHYGQGKADALRAEARAIFPGSDLAVEGQTIEVRPGE